MPDISCCNNENCPLKMKCYRFTAPRSDWQSFCDYQPINGKCEDFWDNAGRRSRFDNHIADTSKKVKILSKTNKKEAI